MNPLIAGAIHDAKNGLNLLNTWLDEARRTTPSLAIDEARAVAARVGAQLVELLVLYRAGEDNLRLVIEDHDLADFCQEVTSEIILPPGSNARIEFDADAVAMLGAWAFDAYQVKLVLQEALRNALRHGKDNIRFAVATQASGGLRFTVSDDGPGFPQEVLDGKTRAMDSASSGIGLIFSRLIAERHATPDGRHGRVELANDGGAVFALVLP
ncbi:MAG: ATP-binding protein [Sulfuritalea sp.]|jgi:signal transduction histidine kinase|nr:ATP-binding protein [Sulfuritalea sp.]